MRSILLTSMALLLAAPMAAQQTQEFHSEAGFTVQIPAEWRRMPDADLRVARQGARLSGDGFALEAGYRVTDVSAFVMAWIDAGDTMTWDEFAEMMTGATGQAQMQEGTELAGQDARLDAPAWDAENHVVWTRAQKPPSPQGLTPVSWSVFTLHPDRRMVLLFVYTSVLGEDEASMRATVLRVVRTIRAD